MVSDLQFLLIEEYGKLLEEVVFVRVLDGNESFEGFVEFLDFFIFLP